jgi:hypothetical protein
MKTKKEIIKNAINGESWYFISRDNMFSVRISNHHANEDKFPETDLNLNLIIGINTTIEDIPIHVMNFLNLSYEELKARNEIDFSSYTHNEFEKCANIFGHKFFIN